MYVTITSHHDETEVYEVTPETHDTMMADAGSDGFNTYGALPTGTFTVAWRNIREIKFTENMPHK